MIERALEALRKLGHGEDRQKSVAAFVLYDLEAGESRGLVYRDVAALVGLPPTQVSHALRWARQEFQRLVLAEIREQTATEEDFRLEVRELLGIDL